MNKVTTKLQGGIGNNLFQIANAYAYSLKYNKELILLNEKHGAIHNSLSSYKDSVLNKITFLEKYNFSNFKIYNEPFFNYTEISECKENILMNGYFQSDKYFKDCEEDIKKMFMSYDINMDDKTKELLKSDNTCSIHVRRGDFLKHPDHHPAQNLNYFMKATKEMPKDSVFLIFSDDIEWCKNNFPKIPNKFYFIEGNKDYEDLYIMSKCKNNIICNSTFSWWGAWLNKNDNKIVVAPSNWFGKAYNNHNTEDLYCDNWIKI